MSISSDGSHYTTDTLQTIYLYEIFYFYNFIKY